MALTDIPEVRLFELEVHADDRGAFTELFRQAWLPETAPAIVQSNLSHSAAGVLRGLHFHRRQADYWCVLGGRAFVVLADLRPGSRTFRRAQTMTFDAGEGRRGLYIPAGVAHGFCALTEVDLLYQVDAYFTGDDEHGVAWNDPELAVAWPIGEPTLSERDRHNPSLAEVLRDADPSAG